MQAPSLFRCGLTCDYTSECVAFLRNFDVDDPDVSLISEKFEKFARRQKSLFVDGYILSDVASAGSGHGEKSVTQLVYEEIDALHALEGPATCIALPFCLSCARICYGSRVHYLCTKASIPEVRRIMSEMGAVVKAMLQRVQADLAADEVAVALQVFNVSSWGRSDAQHLRSLLGHLKKLCKVLGLDPKPIVPVIAAAGPKLASLVQAAQNQKWPVNNRIAWSWVLQPAWRAQHMPRSPWVPECEQLLCFYIGVKINTTTLERNLSQLLTQLHAHSGPLEESGATMASILEVASEGPKTESEFFQQAEAGSEGGQLVPTEFAVKCAQLWIQCFGRRFRASYRIGKPTKEAAAGHLPGTLVSVITGRAAAAHAASQAAASAQFESAPGDQQALLAI